MRPKVVIPVIALGLVVVVCWLFLRPKGDAANNPAPAADQIAEARTAARPSTNWDAKLDSLATSREGRPGETNNPAAPETTHEAYVAERVAQLGDLAMEEDAASLDTILSELTNRDPEIRKAAREAAVQFGSRDAIPKLADAELQTDDAHEKAALADAIEFLKLPSLSEFDAQARADGTAQAKPARTKAGLRKTSTPPPAVPAPQ
jgi:hypothetical protein